ncbi:hypothetical protein BH10PSE14_BH10PSE14_28000 [soil metagenome]
MGRRAVSIGFAAMQPASAVAHAPAVRFGPVTKLFNALSRPSAGDAHFLTRTIARPVTGGLRNRNAGSRVGRMEEEKESA